MPLSSGPQLPQFFWVPSSYSPHKREKRMGEVRPVWLATRSRSCLQENGKRISRTTERVLFTSPCQYTPNHLLCQKPSTVFSSWRSGTSSGRGTGISAETQDLQTRWIVE